MGIVYIATFQNVSVTAAQDLFEVTCPTAKSVILHEIKITQSSEIGDAQAEMLRYTIKRGQGTITSGSGGSTPTAVSAIPGLTFSGTVEANNTTRAVVGTGTLTTLEEEAEHVANGYHHLPTPEVRHEFAGGDRIIVGLESTPADAVSMSGNIIFEVIGGV